ncbi:MAG: hypothetical protein GDA40_12165, partial [Rhodobacteraceae bacterium]|nr:hypothetical protein [Paracoccaceae bacterium]
MDDDLVNEGAARSTTITHRATGGGYDGISSSIDVSVNDTDYEQIVMDTTLAVARVVADHMIDSVSARVKANRTPGFQSNASAGGGPSSQGFGFDASGSLHATPAGGGLANHGLGVQDVPSGTWMSLTSDIEQGGSLSFWSAWSHSRLDTAHGNIDADSTLNTFTVGSDYKREDWLFGIAVAQNHGDIEYTDAALSLDVGSAEMDLTVFVPYASVELSDVLSL